MANRVVVWISVCVWLGNAITVALAADGCKTHNDCQDYLWFKRSCCLYTFGEKRCVFGTCENDYCRTDNDCADSALCCRSKKCVKNGCLGCNKNTDCHYHHYCCKKAFPLGEMFCALNCVNQPCNSNDDCGGPFECCRSGKCSITGCYDRCTSNSECHLGEFCCKKRRTWGDGCSKSCVGSFCTSVDDCGGPNECCVSNKCVTSDCDFGKCSADCAGKSCATSEDCGDLGEICNSHHICEPIVTTAYPTLDPTSKSRHSSHSSFPMWVIVVVVSLFIPLIPLAMAIICHFKRKRSAPATQVIRGTMDLQNTTNYAEVTPGMQGTESPSPPPPYESVAQENPRNHRAAIQNTRQQFSENPPPYSEIDAFENFHHQGNAYQNESEGCVVPNNPSQSPIFLNA